MSHFTVGTENGAKEGSMRIRMFAAAGIRLHSLLAWLIARGYHLIGVPTLNHQARILADWALSMFFRADTIPLNDLEHPERELMPRRASSNPRETSADASGSGRRPADPARSI